jgi:hypothetical protein
MEIKKNLNQNNNILIYEKIIIHDSEYEIYNPEIFKVNLEEKYYYFLCQICSCLVIDPMNCKNCERIFCKKCIKDYSRYTNLCKNRCRLELTPLSRLLRNIFEQIKIKCSFYYKGCNEYLNCQNFYEHVNLCKYGPFKCKNSNCFFIDSEEKVIEHSLCCHNHINTNNHKQLKLDSYQNNKKKCPHCKKLFKDKIISSHIYVCEQQEIECNECRNVMNLFEYKNHLQDNNCLVAKFENRIFILQERIFENENLLKIYEKQKNENKNKINITSFNSLSEANTDTITLTNYIQKEKSKIYCFI